MSRKASAKQITPKSATTATTSILSKEEEYLKINAEIEAKTANLVQEADEVLKANEKLLSEALLFNHIKHDNYLNSIVGGDAPLIQATKTNTKRDEFRIKSNYSSLLNIDTAYDDQEDIDLELIKKDLMPKQTQEMSNDAQIRFFKAKLKVLQEELESMQQSLKQKDDENTKLVGRLKEFEDERQKQTRLTQAQQATIDKLKKQNEESSLKFASLDVQVKNLKKENEQLKQDSKKYSQDQSQIELKYNRALDEIEKLKQQLHKQQSSTKDLNENERKRVEQLQFENKKLEKQKQELIQAFKKQLKLIDILKKQKLHLESARLLQFTEDEFIKALEWNSNAN